jgi:hypothetical protein
MSVSDLDVCNLAFEGNLVKLKQEIEEKKDLILVKDQVEIYWKQMTFLCISITTPLSVDFILSDCSLVDKFYCNILKISTWYF